MTPRRRLADLHPGLLASAVVWAALATGCAATVPPPARGTLAHPTMTTNEVATPLDAHVRAVSEGSSGTLGGAGGGCGCN